MKTVEIKGWIFAKPATGWEGAGIKYEFSSFDYEAACARGACNEWRSYRKVVEHTIRIDVPDDIDPTALMLKALESERDDLRAAFQMKISEINDKISKLQALTFDPA
ncbi:hypothetical protein ACKZDW_02300 (plasmid) [Ralstonia syzygii subsp. celebesensis]|uniref:hypothetical protein n=1 Tax=Ralstonia syzygii TaxID=28097 RepID=UPI00387E0EC4